MINKKTYLIILAIIIVFSVVLFSMFGLENIKEEKKETTIIVGNSAVWKLQNKRWDSIKGKTEIEKLSWQKYDIFEKNEKVGNYYLWFDNNKWYVFDDNKEAVNIEGDILGIRSTEKIDVYSTTETEITDMTTVNTMLEKNDIEDDNFTSKYKIDFDFDNDGETEEFYVISNVFSMDSNPEKNFSIVYMVKNNKIYPIFEDISTNYSLNGCKPYFAAFLDLNSDNTKEFILNCAGYSVNTINNSLYEFKDDEFKILISN